MASNPYLPVEIPIELERRQKKYPDQPSQWWPRSFYENGKVWLECAEQYDLHPRAPDFEGVPVEAKLKYQVYLLTAGVFQALRVISPENDIPEMPEYELVFRLHAALETDLGPVLKDAIRLFDLRRSGSEKSRRVRGFLNEQEFTKLYNEACSGLPAKSSNTAIAREMCRQGYNSKPESAAKRISQLKLVHPEKRY